MPQMMPLNWLILLSIFSLILLLFNSLNYYSTLYTTKTYQSKKLSKSINWKW
uniref:ATP synthase complex subunit 8 n=1 Tax=Rhopaea magnicornis TaxID=272071 RepID=C8YXD3_9SCAR|nr:ATP synthase F0 subunit 8 [Rhopaea magnicornis]ACO92567.1 ATP synthase F0 subunit 8 [Rhopaea magnicornis]